MPRRRLETGQACVKQGPWSTPGLRAAALCLPALGPVAGVGAHRPPAMRKRAGSRTARARLTGGGEENLGAPRGLFEKLREWAAARCDARGSPSRPPPRRGGDGCLPSMHGEGLGGRRTLLAGRNRAVRPCLETPGPNQPWNACVKAPLVLDSLFCTRLRRASMIQRQATNHDAQELGRYCRGTAVAGAVPPGAAVQVHCRPLADDLPDR